MADELVDRIVHWHREGFAPPFRIFMVLTERCNLDCPMCCYAARFQTAGRTHAEAPAQVFLDIVDEAAALGVKQFILVGGEPFVRRELTVDVMRAIARAGMTGEVTTNGTLLSADDLAAVVDAGFDRIIFSLDADAAELHDALRGGAGTFARCVGTIEALRRLRAARGGAKPRVDVLTVASRENFDRLPRIAGLVVRLRVDRWLVQHMTPTSGPAEAMMLREDDIPRFTERVREAAAVLATAGVETNLSALMDGSFCATAGRLDQWLAAEGHGLPQGIFRTGCLMPYTQVIVLPDGSFQPCYLSNDARVAHGSGLSLTAFWRGEEMGRLRAALASGNVPEYCRGCCVGEVAEGRLTRIEAMYCAGLREDAIRLIHSLFAAAPEEAVRVCSRILDRMPADPVVRDLLVRYRLS